MFSHFFQCRKFFINYPRLKPNNYVSEFFYVFAIPRYCFRNVHVISGLRIWIPIELYTQTSSIFKAYYYLSKKSANWTQKCVRPVASRWGVRKVVFPFSRILTSLQLTYIFYELDVIIIVLLRWRNCRQKFHLRHFFNYERNLRWV